MKKIFHMIVVLVAILATTTQTFAQQYSVRRIVRAQLVAGTLTVPSDTLCYNSPSQQITGTAATGGKPTPATTYQWWLKINAGSWTSILGSTALHHQTGVLTPGDYQYRRIDNNAGCGFIDTTNIINIHVEANFVAGTATGGGNYCYNTLGTTTTCTAATGGDPTTITQVMETSTDGTIWTPSANTTLTYTPAGLMTSSQYVRWKFTGNCGIVYSNTILYNVYPAFVAGTVSTTTITPLCNGANAGTATATLSSGGAPTTTVEWEISPDALAWSNTGNTSLNLSLGMVTVDKYARMRYMNNCDTVWSNVLYFQVYPILAHGGTPVVTGNDTICKNTDPGTIDAPAATGGVPAGTTYQWQTRITGTTPWSNVLVNGTSEDYDIPVLDTSRQYQRIATNACNGSVTSPLISIFVYRTFNAGVVGNDAETCSGNAQAAITQITAASGGSGSYGYQWIVSTDNEATWNNAPGASTNTGYSPATVTTPVDLEYFYRRVVTDLNGCGSSPSTVQ